MKMEIKVPSMGESITEATVGAILKPTGSTVKMDEEVVELETDKVNQVLYAPAVGTISLFIKSGDTVKIGQVIGEVEATTGKIPEKVDKSEQKLEAPRSKAEQPPQPVKPKPLVPKVEETRPRETRRRMTKVRSLIATRLVETQHQAAILTTFNEIDMSKVMELRTAQKESFLQKYGVKLGLMSFFVKAAVSALREFPNVNSYISGEDLVHREYYDVGVAIGSERGLFVPVVRECDLLSFADIERQIEGYAERARNGTLTPGDLQGGGFTITNGGTYGSLLSTPILNPSQCGILGMHKIEKRPVVVDDQIVIRPMMYVALSYDHRIIDGKEAVSFLVHIKNFIESMKESF